MYIVKKLYKTYNKRKLQVYDNKKFLGEITVFHGWISISNRENHDILRKSAMENLWWLLGKDCNKETWVEDIDYWDKGKLHPQLIHNIEITEQISEYTDWSGKKAISKRPYIKIEAGKGTVLELYYENHESEIRRNCMLRFSCLEAANNWLERQQGYYERKIERLNRQLKRYTNLIQKYSNRY